MTLHDGRMALFSMSLNKNQLACRRVLAITIVMNSLEPQPQKDSSGRRELLHWLTISNDRIFRTLHKLLGAKKRTAKPSMRHVSATSDHWTFKNVPLTGPTIQIYLTPDCKNMAVKEGGMFQQLGALPWGFSAHRFA